MSGKGRILGTALACFGLLAAALFGCARDTAMQPHTGTGLSLKVSTAPRGATAPTVGAVDTMRVEVRDANGADLANLDIPIAAGQRTFQAALDVPAGAGRIVTVMGLGPRPVGSGDPPPTDRGVLFLDRVDNVDIAAGQSVPLAITLRLFVPEFLAPELLDGTSHRLRWHRVPGAVRYELRRATDGAPIVTSLTDTTFLGEGLPAQYQVRAFELGGRRSAVSDPLTVALPNTPGVPAGLTATGITSTRIDLAWQAVTGAGAVTYDLERRVLPSATFASLATGLTGTTFSDTGVDADHTYGYRVRAVGRGGSSDFSAEVTGNSIPALPGAPTGLTATATASGTRVQLAWTKGTGRVDAYDVERRVPPAAFAVLTSLAGDRLAYDDDSVVERTSYEYRVIPRNVTGVGPASNVAAVTTPTAPPAAPTNLAATAVGAAEIRLDWTDNAANESGFELQRAVGAGGAFDTIVQLVANVQTFPDIKLAEKTLYRYRVRALRGEVASDWSAEASATTSGAPPTAPTNLAARTLGATSVRLDWVDNATNEDSLRVERKNGATFVRVAVLPPNSITYDVIELTPLTSYTFRVVAINAAGESPSVEVNVTTPGTAPTAPTQLTGSALAWNRVRLFWTDTSNDETSFDILRQHNQESVFFSVGANVEAFTDTTVVGSTTYNYSVRARNNVDVSGYAGPASVTTPPGPPSVPPNFAAAPVSGSVITLSWSASTGGPVTYLLEMRLPPAAFAPLATVSNTIFSRDVTGLLPNTTYEFRIKARNANGDSDWSPVASARTAQTLPNAPSGLNGTALVGGVSVQLNWTDNANNETGFEIQARLNQGGTFAAVAHPGADATSAVVSGLLPSTAYDFRVAASNELGLSGFSNIVLVTTLAAPPATPVNLVATGTSTTRIDLTWQAGSGGGSVTDYSLERRLLPAGSFAVIGNPSGGQLGYGDQGLPPDTPYEYRIRAHNAAGFSDYSNVAPARTLLDPPAIPSGVLAPAVDGTSTQIRVTWNEPTSGGAPASYELFYRLQGANTFDPLGTIAGPALQYIATGLLPSTAYEFRLRASNATATSGLSSIATGRTNPTPPSGLNGFYFDNDGQDEVDLLWRDNSGDETGFVIQRALDSADPAWSDLSTVQANSPNYSDGDFTGFPVFRYRVAALGLAGSRSEYSNEITVNSNPAFLPPPDNFVPNPLDASRINLEWTDQAFNETGYELQVGTSLGTFVAYSPLDTLPPNTSSYLLTGLTPGITYYWRLRTLGTLGQTSSFAYTLGQTAGTAPAAPGIPGYNYDTLTGTLTIAWNDFSLNETRFDISRKLSAGGPTVVIGSVGINQNVFSFSATITTSYIYYVTAVNSFGSNTSPGKSVP